MLRHCSLSYCFTTSSLVPTLNFSVTTNFMFPQFLADSQEQFLLRESGLLLFQPRVNEVSSVVHPDQISK